VLTGFSGILLNHLIVLNKTGVSSDKYLRLQKDYLILYDGFGNLTSYYNISLEMYSELKSEYYFIESHYQSLQAENINLKQENEEYKNLCDNFKENITIIQKEIAELMDENMILQNILNKYNTLGDEIMLENNSKIEINANEDVTLSYSNTLSGYLTINFTSSREIYLWVGSSIDENNYYARYPSFPETCYNGYYKIPVCQNIYIYIKNADFTYKTTIDISVKLTI
jgi:hypothetical protein